MAHDDRARDDTGGVGPPANQIEVRMQATLICTCGVTMLFTSVGAYCVNRHCPNHAKFYDLPTVTLVEKPK
jgi:hypothetical protein